MMKKIATWYWIVTILFAGFMIVTSIPNVMMSKDSVELITGLGYPKYFIPFIGVAKIVGAITILIPNLNRLKEWAYAGLFFDLAGATYSALALYGFQVPILFMLVFFAFLFLSYYLWHRKKGLVAGA